MNKSSKAPKVSLLSKQHKERKYLGQLQTTFNEFFRQPQTMKMLSVKTGIDRANVCRYCRKFRLRKTLWSVRKGMCPITKRIVNFWTTNPDLVPKDPQTKLF